MKKILFPLAVITLSSVMMPAFAKDKLPANAVTAIEQTLTDYYGINNQNDCSLFSYKSPNGEKIQYCLKVEKSEVKILKNQPQLYILVSGNAFTKTGEELSKQTVNGLFIFYKNDNQWKLTASEPYIFNANKSQNNSFELVQIAPDKFGWHRENKFTLSDCIIEYEYIYAKVGSEVKKIYEPDQPNRICLSNGESRNLFKANVKFLKQKTTINGFYPLQITAIEYDYPDDDDIKKTKVQTSTYQMNFKPYTQKYERPSTGSVKINAKSSY